MLPAAGVYHFPWEINAESVPEGKTLRTFGRAKSYSVFKHWCSHANRHALYPARYKGYQRGLLQITVSENFCIPRLQSYDMVSSQSTFTAQHSSVNYCIRVCTKFVEPFQAQLGSLYILLGETEYDNGGELMLQARVITCVEGMNVQLLMKAIEEQRKYFQEREKTAEGTTS